MDSCLRRNDEWAAARFIRRWDEMTKEEYDDEHQRSYIRYEYEWRLRSFEQAIGFAKLAVNGLLTISGGAVIAIAAFIGDAWSEKCHLGSTDFFRFF